MSFSRGEVVLVPVPFADLTSRKVRPAVIVGHSSHAGDLFVAPVSSRLQNVDLAIRDWQIAGLNVRCGVKSQLATIEDRLVIKSLGTLSPRDWAALETQLRAWLQL